MCGGISFFLLNLSVALIIYPDQNATREKEHSTRPLPSAVSPQKRHIKTLEKTNKRRLSVQRNRVQNTLAHSSPEPAGPLPVGPRGPRAVPGPKRRRWPKPWRPKVGPGIPIPREPLVHKPGPNIWSRVRPVTFELFEVNRR